MSEWYDNQKKPNSNFRKLLKERIDKANPRRKLASEQAQSLNKLEVNKFIFFVKKISQKRL